MLASFPGKSRVSERSAGRPAELAEEIIDDHPDFPEARAELLALLDVTPPSAGEALARLRSSAARTVPDFLPVARHEEGDSFYEASYTPLL